MSVERLFFSRTGDVYHLGEAIQPGYVGLVYDELNTSEPFIVAACSEQDEGGVAISLRSDELVGSLDGQIGLPKTTLDKVRAINPLTGLIFKGKVRLIDGDEGTVVIQHITADQARLN